MKPFSQRSKVVFSGLLLAAGMAVAQTYPA